MLLIRQTDEFERWLAGLSDQRAKGKILARIQRLKFGNPGDVKPIGQGLSELRIREGKGYRVYYAQRGSVLVILLSGEINPPNQMISSTQRHCSKEWSFDMTKLKDFDPAEFLETPEALAAFLTDAFESGNPSLVAEALGIAARAKGMSEIALDAGLSRESLYRSLSADGNPELGTILKVLSAMGLTTSVRAAPAV